VVRTQYRLKKMGQFFEVNPWRTRDKREYLHQANQGAPPFDCGNRRGSGRPKA